MSSRHLQIHERFSLEKTRMVISFSGWMDGGDVSTGVVKYMIETLDARHCASIDPADFYIYHFPGSMEVSALFRPTARIEQGLIQNFEGPRNVFYADPLNNLLLFEGREPNLKWAEYAEAIFTAAEEFDVRAIYFVGSVSGLIPHTRNPVFWSSTTSEEMRDFVVRHGLSPTNYEGPASFGTFLAVEAKKRGLEMATVVAAIPSYVEGRNVRCIEAATQKIVDLLGIHLDMSELHGESQAWLKGVSKLVSKRKDLAEQIRKLEEFYDNELRSNTPENDATPPTDQDLRTWFERQNLKLE